MPKQKRLTIGQLSERSGVAASALRFYEEKGLLFPSRNEGNQRRYERSALRRVAVIRAAQRVGISLNEIREALDTLPHGRTPTKRDWARLSERWRVELDDRIRALELLRDTLTGCIGCGCLSLENCALFNPGDRAGERGPGPRYWLEGPPEGGDG